MTTDPKTGFTGVVLVASFAILRPSMAIFSAEVTLPRPFGRCELSVMVESRGSHEKAVRRGENPNPDEYERLSCRRASRGRQDHLVEEAI